MHKLLDEVGHGWWLGQQSRGLSHRTPEFDSSVKPQGREVCDVAPCNVKEAAILSQTMTFLLNLPMFILCLNLTYVSLCLNPKQATISAKLEPSNPPV